MARFLLWLSASFCLLAGCEPPAPATGHTVLSRDLSQLRSRFNADVGKVRAIFLAAPT